MSTCSITCGTGKDSNANFVNQLRDASDVIRMRRQQGIARNYQVLKAKNLSPIGGIPLKDLLDMAHTTQSYGPSNALLSAHGYVTPQCTPCGTGTLTPFSTLKVSLSLIRY